MGRITINGISLDPFRADVTFAALRPAAVKAVESGYILIQTDRPLGPAELAQLAAAGVQVIEYVPESTYVCRATPEGLASARKLAFVTWADDYGTSFKLSPALRRVGGIPGGGPGTAAIAPADNLARDRVTVDVVMHRGEDPEKLRADVASAAGLDPTTIPVGRRKVRLTVERGRLPALSQLREVRHIELFVAPHFTNNVARDILMGGTLQAAGALRGTGQVVAVCDTGFDGGTTAPTHPAFAGRVLGLYAMGRPTATDPDGHGTHVCGSILGDGIMADGGVLQGVAPGAQLVVQSVLDGVGGMGGLPTDLHDLFAPPYHDHGARVHSNSWCSNVAGAYTAPAYEVDDFVWSHRDCVVCVAVGNAGADSLGIGSVAPGSVGSPATAKNCIAVGASENLRPGFALPTSHGPSTYGDCWASSFPAEKIRSDFVADNPEGMAAFSSRGPTANGRVRPDLVAPGTAVLSARSSLAGPINVGWGLSADPLYYYEGGTSMATPLVAGCAAVVREFLHGQGIAFPSAALVKAMLINGATALRGQFIPPEVTAPPCNSQGFGRVNLDATVGPMTGGASLAFVDEAAALETGQATVIQRVIPAGRTTLKATLVWTDAPGEALQNDLDLIVELPDGRVLHGNAAAGSPDFDRTNNVEQVTVTDAPEGTATVTVTAFRTILPQPYALVVRVG